MNTLSFYSKPEIKPAAFIIRHAERDPINSMINPFEALLTERGKDDSIKLGGHLAPLGPLQIFHSPVPRCRQTAENIRIGFIHSKGSSEQVQELFDLGGPYITGNWVEVADIINKMGHAAFIRKWFDGLLPPDLIMPLEQAGYNQMHILTSQLLEGAAATINITHDWNIMILREFFLKLRHEDIGEPAYLDGLMAFVQKNAIHLIYHEYETSLSLENAL